MPGKFGFRYVYSTKHIEKVFNKIPSTGRPDKLNIKYLKDTWLLKNDQYSGVLVILTDMKFLEGGVPTDLYAEYQNPSVAKKALSRGIKKAYPDLFKAFPEAYNLSVTELKGYMKQQTGSEDSTVSKMVSTFKKLCSMAEFSKSGTTSGLEDRNTSGGRSDRPPNHR